MNPEVEILYTNWRGETAVRRIIPVHLGLRSNQWHPERQWLLWAKDLEKGQYRDFAMNGILAWGAEAVKVALEERK